MAYKGRGNGSTNAQCPYYQSEDIKTIQCECMAGFGWLKFKSEEKKLEFEACHCFLYPAPCVIAKGLDDMYEREG